MEASTSASSDSTTALHLLELDFPLEDLTQLSSTQLALTQYNFDSTPAVTANARALWWRRRAAANEGSRRTQTASTSAVPIPASGGQGSEVDEVVPKSFWDDMEKTLATRIGSPTSTLPTRPHSLPSRPPRPRVDPVFQPLVDVLKESARAGVLRPLKSGVGSTFKQRYPHAYRDAGVSTFAAYAQRAYDRGVCDQGHGEVAGRDWISLPQIPQPPLPNVIVSLGKHTFAPQQPPPTASSQFRPLLDFLASRHAKGESHPLRSQVGAGLKLAYPNLYRDIGFESFKELAYAAKDQGLVLLGKGNSDGKDWIALDETAETEDEFEFPSLPVLNSESRRPTPPPRLPTPPATRATPQDDFHSSDLSFSLSDLNALTSGQLVLVQFHEDVQVGKDSPLNAEAETIFWTRRSRDWERRIVKEPAVVAPAAAAVAPATSSRRPALPPPAEPRAPPPHAPVYPNQPPIIYPNLLAPKHPDERYRRPSSPRRQSPRRNDAPQRSSPPPFSRARAPSPPHSSTAPLTDVLSPNLLNTLTTVFLSNLPSSISSRSHISNLLPSSLAPDCTVLYKSFSPAGARTANVAYRSRAAAGDARKELERRWRIDTEDRSVGEVKFEWGDVRSELRERLWDDSRREERSARERRGNEVGFERRPVESRGERRDVEPFFERRNVERREYEPAMERREYAPVAERRNEPSVEQRSFEPVGRGRSIEPPFVPVELVMKRRVEWGAVEAPLLSDEWGSPELKRSRVDAAPADFGPSPAAAAATSAPTRPLYEDRRAYPNPTSDGRSASQTPSTTERPAQASFSGRPSQARFPWATSVAATSDVRSPATRARTTSVGDIEGSEPAKRARTTSEMLDQRKTPSALGTPSSSSSFNRPRPSPSTPVDSRFTPSKNWANGASPSSTSHPRGRSPQLSPNGSNDHASSSTARNGAQHVDRRESSVDLTTRRREPSWTTSSFGAERARTRGASPGLLERFGV